MIRPAGEPDLAAIQEVERATGILFAQIGMLTVAEDEPPPTDELRAFAEAGRAWVAVDQHGTVVAHLLAAIVDGNAHVEQVSVHPDHAHRRIGHRLIENLEQWARGQSAPGRAPLPAMTLTTFTEVSWNGPYYERLGFGYLTADEETPGLRSIRAAEAARGLDRWPRACMRKDLWPCGTGVSGRRTLNPPLPKGAATADPPIAPRRGTAG